MELLSPEDRINLWRTVNVSEGQTRVSLIHYVAKDILDSLSRLDLYGDYTSLVTESLDTIDLAGLFGRDEMRLAFEQLHEDVEGVEKMGSELAALLREGAQLAHLDVERKVKALQLADEWQTHVLERSHSDHGFLTVADIAAMYQVTTQAVYKWLAAGRIVGDRRPGGSWRIPSDQFGSRSREERERLLRTQIQTLRSQGGDIYSDDEIAEALRGDV